MYRIVLDTNLLVSASFHPANSIPSRVLDAWFDKRYMLVVSPKLMQEYGRVLRYERIRRASRWTGEELTELISLIAHTAEVKTQDNVQIKACRDPDDDKFLITAVEGNANYIVSGDDDLLTLNPFKGIQIIRPAEFLSLL